MRKKLFRGETDVKNKDEWENIPLEAVKLFFFDVSVTRSFSNATWPSRTQCMMGLSAAGESGWAEFTLIHPEREKDALKETLSMLRGKTLAEAFALCRQWRGMQPDAVSETVECALLDLAARVKGVSVFEFLRLPVPVESRVPAMACILQKDKENAAALAGNVPWHFLKVKLFGTFDEDLALLRAVRKAIPETTFLLADVNCGYQPAYCEHPDFRHLADLLRRFRDAGLNACEDPAALSLKQIRILQKEVEGCLIIPDEPMRPAYRIVERESEFPEISNLHPHCMGSIQSTVELAQKIRSGGGKIMIGDNSLIGVGCPIWQQLALGFGALWCEAMEKPLEGSERISGCIRNSPVELENGILRLNPAKLRTGFSFTLEEEKLRSEADHFREWKC